MNSAQPAIITHNLSRSFGKRNAVKQLNIEVAKGQIFSLLGTNGAGKTTTIKMLSCLLPPTKGKAEVLGYDISMHPQQIKKIIGVSPQETAIAEHLTTLENLVFMGGVFGMSKSTSKKRALELMELMELEPRKDQAKKLSGGQKRRLSIAMALMSDPQVLFLDEPTLGLDPHARKAVWNYIEKLKGDKTILLTTHYLEEADQLADQIAIMDDGSIIEAGTSNELKDKHSSGQTLHIKASNVPDDIVDLLRQRNFKSELKNHELTVRAKELDIYGVLDILRNHEVKIKSIQSIEPTLEEIFIKLTGKEAQS